jgi:hypothetical protein
MTRIDLSDSILSTITKLSEGNPGAMTVCMQLSTKEKDIDKDSAIQGLGSLLSLDTYEIYGADIWMLYKDVCGEDIEKTIAALRSCQLGFTAVSDLKYAIAHYGDGVYMELIMAKVKEELPNFGLEKGEE